MKRKLYLFSFALLLLTGCGTTTYLKDSSNISKAKKSYDKILVVAKAKNKAIRIKFENQVVKDLAAQGVVAESSKDIIKIESFDEKVPESKIEELRIKLIQDGFSGVIVTNLINTSEYTDVLPGGTSTGYYPLRYGSFGSYYGSYQVTYWEPDDYKDGVEYSLESCLYDIRVDQKDNLQWVGRFKVRDPESLISTIEKYSYELTAALLDQSIAPK